jgi:hypothetical protein
MNISRLIITSAAAGILAAVFTGPALAAPASGHRPRPAVPVPAAAQSARTTTVNSLAAVSCTSASFCMAVGSNGPSTAAQIWNGSIWRALSVPVPGQLTGVSCLSATKCLVVGDGSSSGVLGQWWNGSTWRTANPLSPPGALISGVSCVSASMCIAVGSTGRSGFGHSMSEEWTGSAWRQLNTPDAGGPADGLRGVSCTSRLKCMAVGFDDISADAGLTLAMQWNGTSWTLLSVLPINEEISSGLSGVSCLSSSDCMAVGGFGGAPLAVHWDGSAWTELSTPGTGVWFGVSCVKGGNCIAVGGYPNGTGFRPALAAEWDGGTWQGLATANPDGRKDEILYGISCTSGVNCLGAGRYDAPAGAQLVLAERWDGASWQVPGSTGYLALTPDGRVASFNTSWYGSERGHLSPGTTAIAIAPYNTGGRAGYQNGGYLILDSSGQVANYNAPWYGSELGHRNGTPVAIAADPVTGGYLILNANGAVANYNAPWYGSQRGHLNGRTKAVSITVDPITGGYWILDSNGGIGNFHAPWLGSESGHVTSPPVAVASEPVPVTNGGYVILNANGSVTGYGTTTSGGEIRRHATGFAIDPETGGYWIINAGGGIASFNAPWFGSLARKTTRAPAGIAGV